MIKIVTIILALVLGRGAMGQELRADMGAFWEAMQRGVKTRYTLRVVDDDGQPVSGANVQISFMMEDSQWIRGLTDADGRFSAEGRSRGEWNFGVRKEGYYRTSGGFEIDYHEGVLVKDGKWQPWNPEITVVLRRIINPIPMYAKRVSTFIPGLGERFGFDLMKGDWISPHGMGTDSDIFFRIDRNIIRETVYDILLKVSFANTEDGIIQTNIILNSDFKMPRYAPQTGYQAEHVVTLGENAEKGYYNTKNWLHWYGFMRTRTAVNEHDASISAHFTKLPHGFRVVGYLADLPTLIFTYYLNPTPNDRNMEFDPSRNLFKGLNSLEEVTEP